MKINKIFYVAGILSLLQSSMLFAQLSVRREYRYPTSYKVVPVTATSKGGAGSTHTIGGMVVPTGFVRRDMGVSLSVKELGVISYKNNLVLPQVDKKIAQRDTSLMLAAVKNNLEDVRKLIRRGASVNAKNKYGVTALMSAAANGYEDIAKELIKNRAYIDAGSLNGTTALMYAARNGHLDMVKLLLKNKANVNKRNKNGQTALMYAIEGGNYEIVKELLDNKAKINIRDRHKTSPLLLAQALKQDYIVDLISEYYGNQSRRAGN